MMKIVVCVRQGLDGEINPFDACAYEEALRIENAEICLLSMAPVSAKDFLYNLTRLGAKRAILLSDKAFAGADTLATAYTLSLAIKKLSPDLVICGRQTLVGDTAQTGAMLSEMLGFSLITNVMGVNNVDPHCVTCVTRDEAEVTAKIPALLTVERINSLRLPRLRSKLGEIEVWNSEDIGADIKKCGLSGSPTRVVKTFENETGKRKCKFIRREELSDVIKESLNKRNFLILDEGSEKKGKLPFICMVGSGPAEFAKTVADRIEEIPLSDAEEIVNRIRELDPPALLWGSDPKSKRLASIVAARMGLGLCADCTLLECEDEKLMMYRPALSGSVIAKIKSLTVPAMATVRTDSGNRSDIIVAAGFGVKDQLDEVTAFAKDLGAELCSSRKLVDNGYAQYDLQVGLTGKTVSPPVYIALGISGAVHHIAGMQRSGTVIAINPDKDAPIFEYADYGIIDKF